MDITDNIKTTKGKANRLDLTEEFAWGKLSGIAGEPNINRYDFFDEYVKHYAWCIGWQEGNRKYKEIMNES
jgi:hypothetical protein